MHLKRNEKYIYAVGMHISPQTIRVRAFHFPLLSLRFPLRLQRKKKISLPTSLATVTIRAPRKAHDAIETWRPILRLCSAENKTVESTQTSNVMHLVRPAQNANCVRVRLRKTMEKTKSILSCSGRMSNVNRLSSNNVVQ